MNQEFILISKLNCSRISYRQISLREGDIVIMDNLSSHKSQVAEEEIRSRKAKVLFLPAYSPDLNPIEKMWSKVKQLLRGIRAKTIEEIYSGNKTAELI